MQAEDIRASTSFSGFVDACYKLCELHKAGEAGRVLKALSTRTQIFIARCYRIDIQPGSDDPESADFAERQFRVDKRIHIRYILAMPQHVAGNLLTKAVPQQST